MHMTRTHIKWFYRPEHDLAKAKYVFGIDSFQALHLAVQDAGVVLESARQKLEWLGQTEDLACPIPAPVAEATAGSARSDCRARVHQVGASSRACSQGETFKNSEAPYLTNPVDKR